jgi:hypothetical protein
MADPFQLFDEIPMEEEEDGSILIGEATDEVEEPQLREFDDNIAPTLDPDTLAEIASKIREEFDDDQQGRAEWLSVYEEGLSSITGEDLTADASGRADRNLTEVTHPLIAEASTQFQARAIGELFPAQGPVGSNVIGETTEELQEQAHRTAAFMNYQVMEEMEEYFPDMDQMLFHLPQVGHTFKKSWFDPTLKRITSRFVRAEDFVVEAGAIDLYTAGRYSQVLRVPRNDYDDYVAENYYLPIPSDSPAIDPTTDQDIEGVNPGILTDSSQVELIECHKYLTIEEDDRRPYVVTMAQATDTIVSIRRNWEEGSNSYKKQVWFTSYKFLPGVGFYGFGLYHVIGGLGKAATGALRSLLDAAAFANMQGGFKLKGRLRGGEIEISPGEFADIDSAVDDINKAIMPLPFKEPSQTMMQLLTFVVETGKRFANTADMNISDANQNTPVGTTVALLEENSRVFSAIHKRLHYSQKQEFKIIAKLNSIYLPSRYPFKVKGGDQYVLRDDFDDRIDIVPVSDPATFSSTQRIAQAQAMLQMAQSAPQYHNLHAALKRMYEAIRVPNYEQVLIDPAATQRLDAVAENVNLMHNRPIKAFEDQDHTAHMKVLDDWFNRLPQQAQQLYMQSYASHRAEHMALYYRAQIQAQMAAEMPPLPDFHDQGSQAPKVDAELDRKISQAAAVIVNSQPQQPIGPEMQGGAGGAAEAAQDPLAAAKMLAEAEAMSIQAKTQADIQAKQAKAQSDMQIAQMKAQFEMQQKQQEAQLDMQIEQIKIQAKAEEARMNAAFSAETDQAKAKAEVELMWQKAQAEIQIAREKAEAQLQQKSLELQAKMQLEARKMDFEEEKADAQLTMELIQGGKPTDG